MSLLLNKWESEVGNCKLEQRGKASPTNGKNVKADLKKQKSWEDVLQGCKGRTRVASCEEPG